MVLRNKKAAFEMSMSTIIIIVLSVSFLILGLVLLKTIFQTATKSTDSIDQKLETELNKIFTDETKNFVIYLGEDNTAKIRAGTTSFNILVASQSLNNVRLADASQIQYKIELVDEGSAQSCITLIGKTKTTSLFYDKLDTWLNSSSADGPLSWKFIKFSVPVDTRVCSQTVRVTAIDKTVVPTGETIGFSSFSLEILKKGLF